MNITMSLFSLIQGRELPTLKKGYLAQHSLLVHKSGPTMDN